MTRLRRRTETVSTVPFPQRTQRHPFLLVLAGPDFGQIFKLELDRETIIGRQEGTADVLIGDHGVSRRHASVLAQQNGARLRDLGSANGTYVGGQRIKDYPLLNGDRIHIGAHSVLKLTYSDEIEAEYQRRLTEGALREPLTGLCNRRYFMERLTAELATTRRHRRPLALLLVDIDHFKAVNDLHGHLAGDEALRVLSQVMRGAVRDSDLLARYGGEEFVILMRDSGLEEGAALAERVRRAVAEHRFPWKGKYLKLTVSIGVGAAGSDCQTEPHELLESADQALYQAKRAGRNRVAPSLSGSLDQAQNQASRSHR